MADLTIDPTEYLDCPADEMVALFSQRGQRPVRTVKTNAQPILVAYEHLYADPTIGVKLLSTENPEGFRTWDEDEVASSRRSDRSARANALLWICSSTPVCVEAMW